MTALRRRWVVRAKPHWLVMWACDHVKAQCACLPASRAHPKPTAVDLERCPDCR